MVSGMSRPQASVKSQKPMEKPPFKPRDGTKEKAGAKKHCSGMERVMGVEPTSKAWEAFILPMNYTRIAYLE